MGRFSGTTDDCAGCGNNRADVVVRVNPSKSERDTVRVGNTIWIPQQARPGDWGIHALGNWDPDISAGANLCESCANLKEPIVWDPLTCTFGPGNWPQPRFVDYAPSNTPDGKPPSGLCDSTPCMTYARNLEKGGCVDYVCDPCTGQWVGFCFTPPYVPPPDPPQEDVVCCYDVSSWSFPVAYSQGCGQWIIGNEDQMTVGCPAGGDVVACPTAVDISFDLTDSSNPIPPAQIAGANWQPWGGPTGCANYVSRPSLANPSHMGARFTIPLPATASNVTWSWTWGDNAGRIIGAVVDCTTGIPWNRGAIVSQTAGCNHYTNGDWVVNDTWTNSGPCDIEIIYTPKPGQSITNGCVVFTALGNSGPGDPEYVANVVANHTVASQLGCLSWDNINQLAFWMNANDRWGNSWVVNGNQICTTEPIGPNTYGPLAGCPDGDSPSQLPTCTGL